MATVKFSDVVKRANTKEDRFNTNKIYYVGGEHIISGELSIHDRGIIKGSTIGPMFYFGFKKGQVLFVSRNPHLKKAAVAQFDGICSEKTFVLETIDENRLLQEYLIIIMRSDDFWNYLEENKNGGVNYFINWSTLANYEFDLPSIEDQKEIADKVWAAYRLKEAYVELLHASRELVKSQFIEMFGDPILNERKWAAEPFEIVAPEIPSSALKGKVWCLQLDMIESDTGKIIDKVIKDDTELNSVVPFNDTNVLYSKLRPLLNKVVVPEESGYCTSELVPLKPNSAVLNRDFLGYMLRTPQYVQYGVKISSGTKMPRVNLKAFRKQPCILPPLPLQEEFAAFARQADKSESLQLKVA